MPFREIERLSPNRDTRQHERLGVLFHHSGMGFDETVEHMLNATSRVSYHCLIHEDGSRCTLVPDNQVAWHAGVSRFLGRGNCNDFLLGVAFAGDTYTVPLSDSQFASALEWLSPRWGRFKWGLERMSDHRQVAPGRKDDLNPVEWERLVAALRGKFARRASDTSFPS
jgi:N-acetyl-anhydromuramoyl-L-alanine amidase